MPQSLNAIICSEPRRLAQTRQLAESFGLPLLDSEQGLSVSGPVLVLGEHVSLQDSELGSPLWIDFDAPDLLRRLQAGRQQPLGRACGLHKQRALRVLDATAGLGQDMLTLAGMGATVTPLERNPVVFLLLEDAFARGAQSSLAKRALAQCEPPRQQDARQCLSTSRNTEWDVVYLDPMFTGYRRRALPKKNMQLLASVCGSDNDAADLLPLARAHARRRVVVKRGPQAPLLAGAQPDLQIKGNRARYDIYLASA